MTAPTQAQGEEIRAILLRLEGEMRALAYACERVGDPRLVRAAAAVVASHIGCFGYEAVPVLKELWPSLIDDDTFQLGEEWTL